MNEGLLYVQVELNPGKQQKIKNGFFLKTDNFSGVQMTSGDSKGDSNRHVWFESNTSSGKGCNTACISKASP